MRTTILCLIPIVFASTLFGCFAATIPGKPPASFDDHDNLVRLIGQKEEQVIEELGPPRQILSDGTRRFLMYWSITSGTNVIFMGWVPVGASGGGKPLMYCMRFELDLYDRVNVYGIKSGRWQSGMTAAEVSSRCRDYFWNENEIDSLDVLWNYYQKPNIEEDE